MQCNYKIERRRRPCFRVSKQDWSGSFAPCVPEAMRKAKRELPGSRIDMSQSVSWRPSWHAHLGHQGVRWKIGAGDVENFSLDLGICVARLYG